MGNCLVTKLNEIVNNGNLSKIGEAKGSITVLETSNCRFVTSVEECVLNLLTEGFYFTQGSEQTQIINNSDNFKAPIGTYVISFSNKYGLSTISGLPVDIDTLQYAKRLSVLSAPFVGKLSSLAHCDALTIISSSYLSNNITGDISDLTPLKNLRNIELRSPYITGNISTIASWNSINNLINSTEGGIRITYSQKINGTLESLVEALKANGKTNGSLILCLYNTSVTFGSYQMLTNVYNSFLKWDASSIIYQLGTDADIADTSKNVKIYAKGISSSQISTWESQGNTVYVVN